MTKDTSNNKICVCGHEKELHNKKQGCTVFGDINKCPCFVFRLAPASEGGEKIEKLTFSFDGIREDLYTALPVARAMQDKINEIIDHLNGK